MFLNPAYFFNIGRPSRSKKISYSDSREYWQARVRKFGKRAVISIDHASDDFDAVKNRDRDILFPILQKYLSGNEKLVLDFGCGSGRFTADLAKLAGCKVIGVDPTEDLIKLAPITESVEYVALNDQHIPLPDESVDVIWIHAVLGCVKNESLGLTLMNLNRVLRKGGVFFLVENTTATPDSEFYAYRSAEEYMNAIPFTSMALVHDYNDAGVNFSEKFSVMVGRKI